MNTLEISELGRAISKDFTERNLPMTESLVKTAKEHQLNKNQLQRIAEVANQETYLTLIKTASEGYVEYGVADVNKAWEKVNQLEKTASLPLDKDYENISRASFTFMEKTASEENPAKEKLEQLELADKAEYLKGNIQFLSNYLLEKQATFQAELKETVEDCKQMLGSKENDFSEIKAVLESQAYHIKEALIQDVESRLQPIFPLEDFSKTASCKCENKKINKNSTLAKKASSLQKLAFEITDVVNLIEDQAEELTKVAGKLQTAGKILLAGSIPAAFFLGNYIGAKKKDPYGMEYPADVYIAAKQKELKNKGY